MLIRTMDITVHATPNARHNVLVSYGDAVLKIKVTASPEGGKANQAIVRLISKELDIAKGDICIVRGEHSRKKKLRIEGVSEDKLHKYFKHNKTLL